MTTFRSKIDFWLIAFLVLALALPLYLAWDVASARMITISTALPAAALTGWLFWATRYVVDNNKLVIHTGLGKISIPLESIKSVEPSRSLLASPALSLDRLEIAYEQDQRILVSPKDKSGFLAAIGIS